MALACPWHCTSYIVSISEFLRHWESRVSSGIQLVLSAPIHVQLYLFTYLYKVAIPSSLSEQLETHGFEFQFKIIRCKNTYPLILPFLPSLSTFQLKYHSFYPGVLP